MTIHTFIDNLVQDSTEYVLTDSDKKTIKYEGVETFIYNKLNSGKFKATKTDDQYDKIVKEKIHFCVNEGRPLHINLATGATKNPNVKTAPGIDWAEVFNISLVRDYLKPIAAAYAPGVNLDYYSVAIFEEKVNLIPQTDVDTYDEQFFELINYFQKYMPTNLRLGLKRVSDNATKDKIYPLLDIEIEKLRSNWLKLSEETRNQKLLRAERNIKFPDTLENKELLILNAALGHDAFCNECWASVVTPLWNEKDSISLGHRYTTGWAIHIRSAQASTVNFWSGTGVLLEKNGSFTTTVLSPKQFLEIEDMIKYEEVNIFKTIPALQDKLRNIPLYHS